jgi:hypothetical protein
MITGAFPCEHTDPHRFLAPSHMRDHWHHSIHAATRHDKMGAIRFAVCHCLCYQWSMARFIHLTSERYSAHIRRVGLKANAVYPGLPVGVFAVPVTPNFVVTHQWLRELRRWHSGPLCGISFTVPDQQMVWVGRYGQAHQPMTAAAAVAYFLKNDAMLGYEVIIPGAIAAKSITHVRRLPQYIGWRYYPGAHGRKPCGCPSCQRGTYGARKIRQAQTL